MERIKAGNTLGNVSVGLGVLSAALVFSIGFCALTGAAGGWLGGIAVVLYVCGASSAFLGVLGFIAGIAGVLDRSRARGTAIAGMVFSLMGICIFLAVLANFQG